MASPKAPQAFLPPDHEKRLPQSLVLGYGRLVGYRFNLELGRETWKIENCPKNKLFTTRRQFIPSRYNCRLEVTSNIAFTLDIFNTPSTNCWIMCGNLESD